MAVEMGQKICIEIMFSLVLLNTEVFFSMLYQPVKYPFIVKLI